ncbi:hypothetical protein [Halalkalibacterium halodurans]|uniref:hypothetical protein n=1 Tax=Halalkalibacterium halodurans TaxID=86665 RepID=UPI002AA99698|nr:hypothetical protein [Halalkalibacterium halodurans]MDY7222107.1 hypothetical protein [Halalkalibacterium halodurans]MDY7243874.1 hypothetical protein [Halalkalibacterium halodurans]
MQRTIQSVSVISQDPEGTHFYGIGTTTMLDGPQIEDIIERNGIFYFYDADDRLLLEIRHCPVIVAFREEGDEK